MIMNITIIGIDPGKQGGIAVMPSTGYPSVYNMPEGDQGIINKLCDIFLATNDRCVAYIEQTPAGMIKTVKTSRIVASNERVLQALCTACDIEWHSAPVIHWQKQFGLYRMREKDRHPDTGKIVYITGNDKKKIHVRKAEKMWTGLLFRTEGNRYLDGRADAMFIAEYGKGQYTGG